MNIFIENGILGIAFVMALSYIRIIYYKEDSANLHIPHLILGFVSFSIGSLIHIELLNGFPKHLLVWAYILSATYAFGIIMVLWDIVLKKDKK